MSDNDGLYLGAALLGLGGVYLLSQSEDGIGGGLGETIREQIESIVAVPQVFSSKTKSILTEVIDNTKAAVDDVIPTGDEIITGSGNAGAGVGFTIGNSLGSAFLNGALSIIAGAGVAGGNFVGRNDLNADNVFSEFSKSLGRIQNNAISSITPENVAKSVLYLPYQTANLIVKDNSTTQKTSVASSINSVLSSQKRSSGSDGIAKLKAFNANTRSSSAVMNTAGINKVTRTLKKAAGVA